MMHEIGELIRARQDFIIAGHSSPDGDAIGSCFGLALALAKMGKNPKVVLEPYAEKYNVIPGSEFLHEGSLDTLVVDVLICLDCADVERLGIACPLFNRASITVCIDHHETNKGFAQYNLLDGEASSTSEMVFRLIESMTPINIDIASAIYAGIVCDTGGFRYSAASKSTLEIAARLTEMGIPFTEIYSELLHKHSFAASKLLGLAIEASARVMDGRIVYTYVTREMISQAGALSTDLDGIVEYLMGTRGADIALFVYEKATEGEIKISMRSRGLHVGLIAAGLGGGGHRLAAGCTLFGTLQERLQQVLSLLEQELLAYEK